MAQQKRNAVQEGNRYRDGVGGTKQNKREQNEKVGRDKKG